MKIIVRNPNCGGGMFFIFILLFFFFRHHCIESLSFAFSSPTFSLPLLCFFCHIFKETKKIVFHWPIQPLVLPAPNRRHQRRRSTICETSITFFFFSIPIYIYYICFLLTLRQFAYYQRYPRRRSRSGGNIFYCFFFYFFLFFRQHCIESLSFAFSCPSFSLPLLCFFRRIFKETEKIVSIDPEREKVNIKWVWSTVPQLDWCRSSVRVLSYILPRYVSYRSSHDLRHFPFSL